MKVSVLAPDLSHNCLGRAYLLAELLEPNFEVEIIGPKLQKEIWKPLKDSYEYKSVDSGDRIYQFAPDIPKLIEIIDGEIILASKPRLQSYGVALLRKLNQNIPVILDIDDWETGLKIIYGRPVAYAWGVPTLINVDSFYYHRVLEIFSNLADSCTVSNRFLQDKFGGEIIPHARDTDIFDPSKYDKHESRKRYNLPMDDDIIMFLGSPRPHKGIEELAQAVNLIDRESTHLVIVGSEDASYENKLKNIGGDSLIIRGKQPFEQIPQWLSTADIIAVPQKRSSATRGQFPAKIFDAMAMGKPILSTDVGDIPYVLKNCGYIVEPGDELVIKNGLLKMLNDIEFRDNLGDQARSKCIQKYSYKSTSPRLAKIVNDTVSNF